MALIVAAFPPTYFAVRLRKSNPAYARLAGFLALALAVHVIFHVADLFVGISALVLGVEALSAAFILVFAALYWKLREEG
ncbi:MAG: hypothetical protein ACE5JE_04100 [Thermoplasmata archaeon]